MQINSSHHGDNSQCVISLEATSRYVGPYSCVISSLDMSLGLLFPTKSKWMMVHKESHLALFKGEISVYDATRALINLNYKLFFIVLLFCVALLFIFAKAEGYL